MKKRSGILALAVGFCLLAALLLSVTGVWAKPTTAKQAQTVAINWLSRDAQPLGALLGRKFKKVQTFSDENGNPLYYVVYLDPEGMVIMPADDLVEPIIAFLSAGQYDPSPTNPLGALVSKDIPGRVLRSREVVAQLTAEGLKALAPETSQAGAQRKWKQLENPSLSPQALTAGASSISDVRVAPLVQSKWSQSTVNSQACYNYYTPPYGEGSPSNYVCGCVATAMAQLMRYWEYPSAGIGVHSYTYYVSNVPYSGNTLGGDNGGGAYVWSDMALIPTLGVTLEQRQAIGRLTWDAGLSVHMYYDTNANGGSGAYMSDVRPALTGTFQYSNAKYGENWPNNLPESNRNAMLNANLNARYPVLLGIYGPPGGHAIVCDGYGYNSTTMYHHLNLGWSGYDDAWYNLPTVATSAGTFTTFDSCIYNVYKPGTGSGSGEIIAGRVTDNNTPATPLSGVTVTATGSGGPYTATTDANGIYALAQVPSGNSFTISASKEGYAFTSQAVSTGTSINGTTITGNRWPIDFVGSGVPAVTLNEALDNAVLSFSTGGNANWYGESTTWYYGNSAARSGAITANQYTQLWTTVTGPGTLSFYWKVSSEAAPPGEYYDYLGVWIDDTRQASLDGEVNWTQKTLTIPPGIHTITWQYSKDDIVSSGSDCGWVDKVVYTPGTPISSILPLLLD